MSSITATRPVHLSALCGRRVTPADASVFSLGRFPLDNSAMASHYLPEPTYAMLLRMVECVDSVAT